MRKDCERVRGGRLEDPLVRLIDSRNMLVLYDETTHNLTMHICPLLALP